MHPSHHKQRLTHLIISYFIISLITCPPCFFAQVQTLEEFKEQSEIAEQQEQARAEAAAEAATREARVAAVTAEADAPAAEEAALAEAEEAPPSAGDEGTTET